MSFSQVRVLPKSLKSSIWDGMAFSVMYGLGESYLAAFAIFLGATEFWLGALSSLPLLAAAISQLHGVQRMHVRDRCRKEFIVRGAFVQGLIWIPIAMLLLYPELDQTAVILLVVLACSYQYFGNVIGPAWMSLMGDLVPEDTRGQYFGLREAFCGLAVVAGVLGGGIVLHVFDEGNSAAMAFFLLFAVAGIARIVSAFYLDRYDSVPYEATDSSRFSFLEFLRSESYRDFSRFSMYQASMYFSVFIIAPYLALYLLRDLQFSYFEYMTFSCLGLTSKLLTVKAWGRIADKLGNKRVIQISGTLLGLLPIPLFLTTNFWIVLFVPPLIGGTAWAGFNLASGNYLFDAIDREARAQATAYLTLLRSLAILAGAAAGSFFISLMSPFEDLMKPIVMLFLISGVMRAFVTYAWRNSFGEKRVESPGKLLQAPSLKRLASRT